MVNLNSFSDSNFSADAQKSGNKNQASNRKLLHVEYPSGGTLQWRATESVRERKEELLHLLSRTSRDHTD